MCDDKYVGKGDTVIVLKAELKRRKLAVSGRKQMLVNRLRAHDNRTRCAQLIQKFWRRKLVGLYLASKGPALTARDQSNNSNDFFTMETLEEIPHERFFSYADGAGMVYGFALLSLLNLRHTASGLVKNPYTNQVIEREVIVLAEKSVRLGRALGYTVPTRISHDGISTVQAAVDVFQEMATLSLTADHRWLTQMPDATLRRFCYQLSVSWRCAPFGLLTRRKICPPDGVLCRAGLPPSEADGQASLAWIVAVARRLCTRAVSTEDRKLGATLFLAVLTKLSPEAGRSLPWLTGMADQYLGQRLHRRLLR